MLDNSLLYVTTVDEVDFYRFKTRLFHYFYKPMANYEKLFSRKIRETLDYVRGGYRTIYMVKDDEIIGYGIIAKGSGRNKFCTRNDVVIGSLYVDEAYRGNGYGNILVKGLILCIDYQYQDVFEYIRHDNVSSIKVAHKNGFNKVNNAEYSGILRTVKINPDGHLGVYRKVKNN